MPDELFKNFNLISLVEKGKIPLKPVIRRYPSGVEIYVARFNGFSWVVANPVTFKSTELAWQAINECVKSDPKFIAHEPPVRRR